MRVRMALALSVLMSLASAGYGQDEQSLVTGNFDQVEVLDVVRQLHEQTGRDFVVAAGVTGKVTARFVDKPLDEVMRVIAATLKIEARQVQDVWVLRMPPAEGGDAQPLPGATGAAGLLPGFEPGEPLAPLPAAGLTPPANPAREGADVGDPTNPETGIVTGRIPVSERNRPWIARLLGLDEGDVPAGGQFNGPPPGEPEDPYANLPPRARVTRNGTILLPNGVVILPSGTTILPDGSVYTPPGPVNYNVPYGWTPPRYDRPLTGGLGLSFNGWQLGLGPGGAGVQPPPISLGGQGALHLPPVFMGPNGPHLGQIGGSGMQYFWDPGAGEWRPAQYYTDRLPPTVHYGEGSPDWRFDRPPGWTYTLPPGSAHLFGNLRR